MKIVVGVLTFCAMIVTVHAAPVITPKGAPIEVMVLGTFHFDNPGQDIANTQVDDVLAPKRQAEIAQIIDGLARFKPTKVAVESQRRQPGTNFSEKYPIYRTAKMEPSRNEVVQLGFGLASRMGHQNVYAVDVEGDFPFEAVMAFAQKSGRAPELEASIKAIQDWTAEQTGHIKTKTLGQVLRLQNDPKSIAADNAFYLNTLQYGALDDQPGANLVARWYERNFKICARIVQIAEPGDRIVVVYGGGHAFLLRHCLGGVPGYSIKEAYEYLPK